MFDAHPRRYQVAVSYAREDGDYVGAVVARLRDANIELFFDRSEEIDLWGKDLYEELARVYGSDAWVCLMFLSQAYAAKAWTNHERRVIQLRALKESWNRILAARLDTTEIPGFPAGVSYLDAASVQPESVAASVVDKLGRLHGERRQSPEPVPPTDPGDAAGRYRLAVVYDPDWFGGGAWALLSDGATHRLARITDGLPGATEFDGTACAFRFDIEPKITLDWVKVEEIKVVVNDWRPLPAYRPLLPQPYQESHVYYVEIDASPGTSYRADYFVATTRKDIGYVRLFRARPETILVRVNARTPGLYDFDIELVCASRNQRLTMSIVRRQTFVFDRF